MSKDNLLLLCNPKEWGEGDKQYEVNDLLYKLEIETWSSGRLTQVVLGMQGVIKVGEDKRKAAELASRGIDKLAPGIYTIFEVTAVNKDNTVKIKVIENLYREERIVPKVPLQEILGTKYGSQGATYLSSDVFNAIRNYKVATFA